MPKSTIFISYPEEDSAIASKLEDAIKALEGNKFSVFRDQSFIEGGTEISSTIYDGLDDTFYFVAIGTDATRSNFSWCGLELGYFTAVNRDGAGLVTCLYHDKIPVLFQSHKCFQMVSLESGQVTELGNVVYEPEESPLHEFFTQLANEHNKLFPAKNAAEFFASVPDWAKKWTAEVTKVYFAALQKRVKDKWYPQGRLEITIPDGNFFRTDAHAIPLDATVQIEASTYSILNSGMPAGLARVTKSWSDFNKLILEQTGAETLARLIRDIIISVLPNKAEAANDIVFLAPNGRYYRVILVMHQIYGNQRREFVINMIETLERNPGGDHRTTILSAGIMLASRYRSIFLEKGARWRPEVLKDLTDNELRIKSRQLLRDLERISAAAAAEGLTDQGMLAKLLGETEEVKDLFDVWWPVLNHLEQAVRSFSEEPTEQHRGEFFKAHSAFVGVSEDLNQRFISLCLKAYQDIIDR